MADLTEELQRIGEMVYRTGAYKYYEELLEALRQEDVENFAAEAVHEALDEQVRLAKRLYGLHGQQPVEVVKERLAAMECDLRCNAAFAAWDSAALDRLELAMYRAAWDEAVLARLELAMYRAAISPAPPPSGGLVCAAVVAVSVCFAFLFVLFRVLSV